MVIPRCEALGGGGRIRRNRWPDSIGTGGRFPSESVAGFNRNQWSLSIGMGGRIGSEYAPQARNGSIRPIPELDRQGSSSRDPTPTVVRVTARFGWATASMNHSI